MAPSDGAKKKYMCVYCHMSKKSRLGRSGLIFFIIIISKTGNSRSGIRFRYFIFEISGKMTNYAVFSSPDPKGHVSYSHHLASVVRRKLFQKSSPLKVLDQWKPNLV